MGRQQRTGCMTTWCNYFLFLLYKNHKCETEASQLCHVCLLLNRTFYLQCEWHCREKDPPQSHFDWIATEKKGERPFISPRWEWILTLIYTVSFFSSSYCLSYSRAFSRVKLSSTNHYPIVCKWASAVERLHLCLSSQSDYILLTHHTGLSRTLNSHNLVNLRMGSQS